eukprot:1647159-Pyramimonas_sp.AAC.1
MSKLFERGAASKTGQGWAEGTRMQKYPWEDCPSLLCGLTVRDKPRASTRPPSPRDRQRSTNVGAMQTHRNQG